MRKFALNEEQLMRKTALTLLLLLTSLATLPFACGQTNYATIPDDWEGLGWNINSPLCSGTVNYPVVIDEQTCIEILKNPNFPSGGPNNREIDCEWYNISPGDTIIYTVYIWTNASSWGDTNILNGARIGIDFYGAYGAGIGRICEVAGANGESDWTATGYNQNYYLQYLRVPWGSYSWVQLTMNFTVQSYYYADAWTSAYTAGQMVTPIMMVAWVIDCSSNSPSETGAIYVRDISLYINATPEPTPIPDATPTPSQTIRPLVNISPTPAYFLPDRTAGGLDTLMGLAAVLAVFAIIIWPFVEDYKRRR